MSHYEKTTHAPASKTREILEERGRQYGEFPSHARVTQQIKCVMFAHRPRSDFDDDMLEALEMIAHKIGRILNGDPFYADSWRDIAGYAQLVADRLDKTGM